MAVDTAAAASAVAMRLVRPATPRDTRMSWQLLLAFAVAAEGLHVLLGGQGWWVSVCLAAAAVLVARAARVAHGVSAHQRAP